MATAFSVGGANSAGHQTRDLTQKNEVQSCGVGESPALHSRNASVARGYTDEGYANEVGGRRLSFAASGEVPIKKETVMPPTQNQPTLERCDMS
jgi:hypothetical protein